MNLGFTLQISKLSGFSERCINHLAVMLNDGYESKYFH